MKAPVNLSTSCYQMASSGDNVISITSGAALVVTHPPSLVTICGYVAERENTMRDEPMSP